jgi:hypothetical protein
MSYNNSTYIQTLERLMSTPRFTLRDKVTLRQMKLYFSIADVTEWSGELDISVSMV